MMSRHDGNSYTRNGHVIPSLRAMTEANLYAERMGRKLPYVISRYYDVPMPEYWRRKVDAAIGAWNERVSEIKPED